MPPNMTDYERTSREFRLEVPERFNFARDVIGRWARDENRLAMHWVGADGAERRHSFRYFAERSDRVAALLRDSGVGKGDRVMVQLARVPAWWEVLLGIMKVGAVAVPGSTLLTARDIAFRTSSAEGVAYITDPEGAGKVDQVRSELPSLRTRVIVEGERDGWIPYHDGLERAGSSPQTEDTRSDDACLIYFTSGTVGYPKMVLHTHASYPIGHIITGRFWLDLGPSDLHWNLSETGWAKAAWSNFFGPWNQGAALFIQDSRGKFDPASTLALLQEYPITTFCAPPTAYRMLVQERLSGVRTRLRHCVGAGEPLNPEVIAAWQSGLGMTIRDGYGQTETVLVCGNFPPLAVRPGSMGRPSPTFELSVIDDDGRELAPGAEGDIAIRVRPRRPIGLFREYWRNPEGTARSYRGDWYVTGDRAVRDEDGYFWFVSRADDVILSAGYRIGPFEVESALVEHPAVQEAAAVGSPDPVRGEIVKAFVILSRGHQPSAALKRELQEHVKAVTAPYKYPREIEFVTELPKTISGKIRRVELRERERAARPAASRAPA